MPKAIFKYKNTGQVFTFTDARQITRLKKDPKFILLEEEKRKYTKKVEEPKEEEE